MPFRQGLDKFVCKSCRFVRDWRYFIYYPVYITIRTRPVHVPVLCDMTHHVAVSVRKWLHHSCNKSRSTVLYSEAVSSLLFARPLCAVHPLHDCTTDVLVGMLVGVYVTCMFAAYVSANRELVGVQNNTTTCTNA